MIENEDVRGGSDYVCSVCGDELALRDLCSCSEDGAEHHVGSCCRG
jgi:hypothetical protein